MGVLMMSGVTAVTDVRHGDVRVIEVPDYDNVVELTRETFRALAGAGMLPRFWDFIEARPAGVYTLPVIAFEPDAVEDTRNVVTLLDDLLEVSPHCSIPACLQDVADTSRGFSLCSVHSSHMDDWDDLLAPVA